MTSIEVRKLGSAGVDWDEARRMFFIHRMDTRDIARFFWVHESIIYNNLSKIKSAPNDFARAS